MADEMSPGLAAEMEARTDAAAAGAGGNGDAADGALVTKLRLAKTDCRIALQSVNRAQGELAGIVAGWASFRDLGDAREWLQGLEAMAVELEGLVHWARGCEDEVLVRMNGRGNA